MARARIQTRSAQNHGMAARRATLTRTAAPRISHHHVAMGETSSAERTRPVAMTACSHGVSSLRLAPHACPPNKPPAAMICAVRAAIFQNRRVGRTCMRRSSADVGCQARGIRVCFARRRGFAQRRVCAGELDTPGGNVPFLLPDGQWLIRGRFPSDSHEFLASGNLTFPRVKSGISTRALPDWMDWPDNGIRQLHAAAS